MDCLTQQLTSLRRQRNFLSSCYQNNYNISSNNHRSDNLLPLPYHITFAIYYCLEASFIPHSTQGEISDNTSRGGWEDNRSQFIILQE